MMMMNSTIIIYNRSLSSVSAARSSSRSLLQSPLRWQRSKDVTKNLLHRNNFLSSSSSAQATTTATANTTTASSSSGSTANTIGKIFFPSLCIITFTLGTWQTKRYFEKVDLVQKRKDDLSLVPLLFEEWRLNHYDGSSNSNNDEGGGASSGSNSRISGGGEEATKSYRRVIIQGKFDHTKSILIGPRGPPPGALATSGPNSGMGGSGGMSSSMQGYWVVTPLVVGEEEEEENRLGESSLSNEDVSSRKEGWLDRLLPWMRRNNSNNTSDQQPRDLKSSSANTNSTMSTKKQSSSDKPTTTTVWINRGWIPRHYINPNTNQIVQSWDEPTGHVTVLSMESQTEKGRGMFTPPSRVDPVVGGKGKSGSMNTNGARSNNGENSVRKLLWMDREAMEEMTNCTTDDHPPLFVQINTTTSADDNDNMKKNEKTFPVQPSEEYVGEFKVTPDVHMGYAITWFGLSGAGVIMTRKLLTRGR
jgi:surfeit locus 1 family protein